MGRRGEREDARVMTKGQVDDVPTVTKPRGEAGKRVESGPHSWPW